MTGLCAAAALAKNFEKVTVLERDALPGPVPRRGVPQSHHTHALLHRGQQIMAQLFPGAFDALLADGASVSDFGQKFRWHHHGTWRVRGRLGIDNWMVSRPLLESRLRDSLAARGNVELRFDCPVEAPIHERGELGGGVWGGVRRGRVQGVRLRDGTVLEADLVVDALGRGSSSSKWLAAWGYGEVEEQRVEIGMTYVSGLFDLHGGHYPDGVMIYPQAPNNHRGGIGLRVEGGRMMVTLFGYHGDRAPLDLAGFVQWAKTLAEPQLHALLSRSSLIGELRQHTMPYQLRRNYAGMQRLPAGYLVMGDALCSFDPSFGQGMTTAAMQAELLSQLRPGQRTARMQRRIARVTDVPWQMTSTEAFCWPESHQEVSLGAALMHRYLNRVVALSAHDLEVYRTLTEVMQFVSPASRLFRPRVLWPVLFGRRERAPAQQRPTATRELSVAAELSGLRRSGS
ncbi:putative secreted protein [Enhygromyxa salina]|uniref:Putative secreted protein n=1 Tax=Enhygromyxa salina TaxID=215803 RepID=A0A0C1ZIX8_9BACT|nr:hypothetical protein [Enhygromyxa salina]KIG17489.1 putative secreted protein [Enhygromyxa salina]